LNAADARSARALSAKSPGRDDTTTTGASYQIVAMSRVFRRRSSAVTSFAVSESAVAGVDVGKPLLGRDGDFEAAAPNCGDDLEHRDCGNGYRAFVDLPRDRPFRCRGQPLRTGHPPYEDVGVEHDPRSTSHSSASTPGASGSS
jgi:hypothetical protein